MVYNCPGGISDSMRTLRERFITFIIPAYNAETTILRCLDSLRFQTDGGFQAVIVDDGSKDGTPGILERYCSEDPERFRFVSQENRGPGAAKNTGIKLAETEYITFLDSDDWMERRFVEKLRKHIEGQANAPDMVFTEPQIYDTVTGRISGWYDMALLERIFREAEEAWRSGLEKGNGTPAAMNTRRDIRLLMLDQSPCRKVYTLELLRQIRFSFPEGVKWEDVKPHFELIRAAERCSILRGTGFFYRVNNSFQITQGRGSSRMDIIPVFRETLSMAKQNKWTKEETALIVRLLIHYTTYSIDIVDEDHIRQLLDGVHTLFREVDRNSFRLYLKRFSEHRLKEQIAVAWTRGPFYRLQEDYLLKECGLGFMKKKMKRKSL